MIRNQFESYLECKKWLKEQEVKREAFFNSLPYTSPPGISYEEFTSSNTSTHGERMAKIADIMAEYDELRKLKKRICELTVFACHKWLSTEIQPKYRCLFRVAFMEEKRTLEQVGEIVGHDLSYVRKIIINECERIKK